MDCSLYMFRTNELGLMVMLHNELCPMYTMSYNFGTGKWCMLKCPEFSLKKGKYDTMAHLMAWKSKLVIFYFPFDHVPILDLNTHKFSKLQEEASYKFDTISPIFVSKTIADEECPAKNKISRDRRSLQESERPNVEP